MARSEPSLAPEWLRNSGTAVSSSSSSSQSDFASSQHNSRNKNYRSKGDINTISTPFLDRSFSTNSHRGSSNGSAKHPYSSFNFSKNRSKGKDMLSVVDPWDNDALPLGNVLIGRDHEQLRRSHSLTTRKPNDQISRGFGNNHNNANGLLRFQKPGFDKDFPTLGAEDKCVGGEVVRVSSPVLSSVVQSLPVSSSALIGREGWTSALAAVPNCGNGSSSLPSPQASGPAAGSLNMAEALVQGPTRTRTPPQGSVKTQRLEELAIKQSRQLIPVVHSTPKGSILSSCDKSKIKPVVRAGELGNIASRSIQQQPSSIPDTSKKLLVLKPAVKESASPNVNGRAVSSQVGITPSMPSAPLKSSSSPKGSNEKRSSSMSQTRSRIEFFNALKQKRSANMSGEGDNSKKLLEGDDDSSSVQPGSVRSFETADTPDEKEAEFLRSLGWVESNCEDEALTHEEISAFIEQYKKLKPSLLQKLSMVEDTTT